MHIAETCVCCLSGKISKKLGKFKPFVSYRMFGLVLSKEPYRDLAEAEFPCLLTNANYCNSCGFIWSETRPDEAQMRRYYKNYFDGDYLLDRSSFEPGFHEIALQFRFNKKAVQERVPQIDEFTEPAKSAKITRVLDYGGDRGLFFPTWTLAESISRFVFDISGNTTSSTHANFISDLDGPSFQFVMCMNVLEHVPYPRHVIERIHKYQEAGDYLFLAVPQDVPDDASETSYRSEFHEHINFFREVSLRAMVKSCDYDVTATKCFDIDIGFKKERTIWLLARKVT